MLFHHQACSCNHTYNPYQQSIPLLEPIFTSIFNPYQQSIPLLEPIFTSIFELFTCSQNHPHNSHQHFLSSVTLPFFASLFSYSHFYNPNQPLPHQSSNSGYIKGTVSKYILFGLAVLISPCFPEICIEITALAITDSLSQVVASNKDVCNKNNKPSTPPSPTPSIYSRYFRTLLIPSQDLACPWKPVV